MPGPSRVPAEYPRQRLTRRRRQPHHPGHCQPPRPRLLPSQPRAFPAVGRRTVGSGSPGCSELPGAVGLGATGTLRQPLACRQLQAGELAGGAPSPTCTRRLPRSHTSGVDFQQADINGAAISDQPLAQYNPTLSVEDPADLLPGHVCPGPVCHLRHRPELPVVLGPGASVRRDRIPGGQARGSSRPGRARSGSGQSRAGRVAQRPLAQLG
jgi:hypothetical protein